MLSVSRSVIPVNQNRAAAELFNYMVFLSEIYGLQSKFCLSEDFLGEKLSELLL